MKGIIILVSYLILSSSGLSEVIPNEECELNQYLFVGENGIIQCSFEVFLGLSWYNSETNRDILFYKPDGVKTGEGYDSGKYDIYPNGSLLVRNVSLDHEGVYTVIKVLSAVDVITAQYDIQVNTVVKPTTSYPVIDECERDETLSCLISVQANGNIRCHIDKSRPAVTLTWITRKHGSERIFASSYSSFSRDNITFMSQAIASYSISQLSLLDMFICHVSSFPKKLVSQQESVVLLDKFVNYTEAVTPNEVNVVVNAHITLPCSVRAIGAVVWKHLPNGKDSWSTILYTIPPPNVYTRYYLSDFDVDSESGLLLTSIKTYHEGLYVCIQQDDRREDITLHDVKVYVNPVPAYPVVDGCNHQQCCVLHVKDGDFLNCSIFGIRPEVTLEWRVLQDTDKVSFEERRHFIKQNEDLFDIILTSRLLISPSSRKGLTIACRVTEQDSHVFKLSTTLELVLENVHINNQPVPAILVTVMSSVITATVTAIIITLHFKRRAAQSERVRREPISEEEAEMYPMIQNVNGNSDPLREKQKIFITQLKTKYSLLYDSVQPIPYIKDRMYCVDRVYVEGAIEQINDVAKNIWKTLTSYRELLTPTCLSSKMQVIEGEPGYGKSTLMLQVLYDWCNDVPSSVLASVDVIIYLRLRQLSGVKSIATAIKRFILPKDSSLSEEDVQSILGQKQNILILLDGYDEYPDQNDPESFVHHILKKELFQEAGVILTTRNCYFPAEITPSARRARLTGFNEESRDAYITKAVTRKNRNASEKIKRRLIENPVLGDLCVVPLFFVIFAHMTHENKDLPNLKSVTTFFSYAIECIHSHMKNKMNNENKTDVDVLVRDHKILDKFAFEALNRNNQEIVWEREELEKQLGKRFYTQYVRIGILVEEEVLVIADQYDTVISPRYKWEVRFYHKIFCEWYAAYHLAEQLRNTDLDNYQSLFKYLDPYDLQYLYRFTCGLDEDASRKIIQHFQSSTENNKMAVLCMFERSSNYEGVLQQIRKMASSTSTLINSDDTKLLQRSTIQILDIASKHQISISCVTLDQSFDTVDKDGIILKSGLVVPKLFTMEKIHIETDDDRELTESEVMKIITYAQESRRLHEISFGRCLLPLSYPDISVNVEIINRNVKVSWCRYGYRFDFDCGLWKVENINTLKTLCSKDLFLKGTDSQLRQRCTIELLRNASDYNISIFSVNILDCSPRMDEFELNLVLTAGVCLPILKSLKALRIRDKSKLSNEEFAAILRYSSQCTSLENLWLDNMLPEAIPAECIPLPLRSRSIKVLRSESGKVKILNFKTGYWQNYEFPAQHSFKPSSFKEPPDMNYFTGC